MAELSDDAGPALVRSLPDYPSRHTQVLAAVCDGSEPPFAGWAAADTSRRRVCRPGGVRR